MKRYLLLFIIAGALCSTGVFSQHSGPVNQNVCVGETALFIVAHSFDYTGFVWEWSSDGSGFVPITPSGGYSGINDDTLIVYTSALNPTGSIRWGYYRCEMTNTLSETDYSETAYLQIYFPPQVRISWDNPCMGQTAHFFSDVTSDISPNSYSYEWTFGDSAEGKSVYPNPSYLYDSPGIFFVTLTIKDANGCTASVDTTVTIFEIPDFQITGDDVVCSNEQDVQYNVNPVVNNTDYEWDIKDFGTITDNSLPQINVDWNKVSDPIQSDISLKVTIHFNDTLFCITKVSKEVLITSYIAPPEGIVFRKPKNSTLLIYKDSIAGPEIKSYKWGYTAGEQDHYIKAENGGERFYCDFMSLNCADTDYWVETSYDSRIDCVTRSHYKCNTDKFGWADMTGAFKLYPVPASDYLKIQSESNHEISEIVIYNVMMQEMIVKKNLAVSENSVLVSLEGLISGVYIIQITDHSGMNNFRVFNIEK